MKIREAARDVEVLDEVDVLVAGGGVAGCAAAVAAAQIEHLLLAIFHWLVRLGPDSHQQLSNGPGIGHRKGTGVERFYLHQTKISLVSQHDRTAATLAD